MARYSFSKPIPPKFEHKLRRHEQSFGKIAPTVVLDTSTSTSTSTLFHKTIGYNRLARKIAIANLGGPVKRKIN